MLSGGAEGGDETEVVQGFLQTTVVEYPDEKIQPVLHAYMAGVRVSNRGREVAR